MTSSLDKMCFPEWRYGRDAACCRAGSGIHFGGRGTAAPAVPHSQSDVRLSRLPSRRYASEEFGPPNKALALQARDNDAPASLRATPGQEAARRQRSAPPQTQATVRDRPSRLHCEAAFDRPATAL